MIEALLCVAAASPKLVAGLVLGIAAQALYAATYEQLATPNNTPMLKAIIGGGKIAIVSLGILLAFKAYTVFQIIHQGY